MKEKVKRNKAENKIPERELGDFFVVLAEPCRKASGHRDEKNRLSAYDFIISTACYFVITSAKSSCISSSSRHFISLLSAFSG